MTATRDRIYEHVERHPGVHFNGIVRALDVAPGQVQHHLRRLGDGVDRRELYGRTHYFPEGVDPWKRGALALLRRETSREIVGIVLRDGAAPAPRIAEDLELARSTVSWHVDRLVEQDVVRRDREGGTVVLRLERPEETVDLLRETDPHLGDLLVDRFSRLLEDLLG